MDTFHYIAISFHILAAVIWIGGAIFLAAVLVPVLRDPALRPHAPELIRRAGVRFRNLGWACLLILVATGAVNLGRWGVDWPRFTSAALWSTAWGRILALKLGLVVVVLALSAMHDFVVGPRARARMRQAPGSREAMRLRRCAGWMGRLNVLLGVVIVALAVMLTRGPPI
ncbi:MAG TPA: DUF4149 domain-containing protein [Gammaproteobacteria bacterium]|nr:DUF4149 domain-containing protein [Gammaproteobacteria bacterium]